jgi:F-type H+-transporting ATPase subunit epsilon
MAHTKFTVEVLTPDGEVFNEEVEMVSTRTVVGSIGVLANHAPLLATLDPAELRLYRSESEIVRFAQSEGYLQVAGNHALLLVEEAHEPDSFASGCSRPKRSSRAPAMTPSAGASPSAIGVAGRHSWGSPKAAPSAEPVPRRARRRLTGPSSTTPTLDQVHVR